MKKYGILGVPVMFLLGACAITSWDRGLAEIEKGQLAFEKREFGTALAEFQRAAQMLPNDVRIFRWLGFAYFQNGRYRESIQAFMQSLSLPHTAFDKGFDYQNWDGMAASQAKMGQFSAAAASEKKAIELNPSRPGQYAALSSYFNGNGQYDEAITAAKRALELRATGALSHHELGFAYRKKKQFDAASG